MKRICTSAFGLMISVTSASAEVDFRWFSAFGNGGVEVAGVRNGEASYFRLMCSSGSVNPEADLQFERGKGGLGPREAIQVVIGNDAYQFEVNEAGVATLNARTVRIEAERLADAIAAAKTPSFVVEMPRLGVSERFLTKDARKAIGRPGKTLIGRCGP